MTPIEPIKLQSLGDKLGTDLAIRYCAPLAFYMLLKANGYLPVNTSPEDYCQAMDRQDLGTKLVTGTLDWSRPKISQYLRSRYGAQIVTWQLGGPATPDIAKMKEAGYLAEDAELGYFRSRVSNKSLEQIVSAGTPVIVTMKPGFGNTASQDIHAVILLAWEGDKVIVVDPDGRNSRREFSAAEITSHISSSGAGSIVLPRG